MKLEHTHVWRGREIAWGVAGSGPAVIFCHGTPFSSLVWRPFAEALSQNFTVYLWDMPGFGLSSKKAEHSVDFGSQAAALANLVEHWQLERPHLVAHDIGGAVALRAHLVEGVEIASLLLLDVVAIPPSGSPFFKFVQEHPGLLGQLPAYIHSAILRAYIENASHRPIAGELLRQLMEPWLGDEGQQAFYRQIADYDEQYLRENEARMESLRVPVRIIWGEEDGWIPRERGYRLESLVSGAELLTIPGAGHLAQVDAPIAVMSELQTWLHRQTARRIQS